jgi:hypothetical protein
VVAVWGVFAPEALPVENTTSVDLHLDVHWTNDTQIIKLIGDVDTSIHDKFNVTAADVQKVNTALHAKFDAVLASVDNASTVLDVHHISNELGAHLEANITLWKTEHEELVTDLHGNATEWQERHDNYTASAEAALGHDQTDEQKIEAALDVQIAKADEKLAAAHLTAGVLKDHLYELYKNGTTLLVKYTQNAQVIVELKTAGAINATAQAEIDHRVAENVEIKSQLHVLVDELAETKAQLNEVENAVKEITIEVKEDVAAAHETAADVKAGVWADVGEVKAEWHSNVSHTEEKIKDHVNEWLDNGAVTDVKISGLDGHTNISVVITFDIKNETTSTGHDLEHKVEVAIAALAGSKLANVTVEAHAGVKRATWTADTQVGGNDIGPSPASASSVVAAVTLMLAGLAAAC